MKRLLAAVMLLAMSGFCQQTPSTPPANEAPKFELDHFYLAILRPAKELAGNVTNRMIEANNGYWQKVGDRGDLILAGPVTGGDGKVAMVAIYRAAKEEDGKQVAEDDPAVQLGLWSAEVHPWMTMKGVLQPIRRYVPTMNYYLGFLLRGPNYSPEDSPEQKKIQEGHLANIKRLGDLGKLATAGPFEDDGPLRGIFVFRTATLEEAQEMTNTDPAVQSGRLAIQLYGWKLPADAFPKK